MGMPQRKYEGPVQVIFVAMMILIVTLATGASNTLSAEVVVVQNMASPVHDKIVEGIAVILKQRPTITSIEDLPRRFTKKTNLLIAIGPDALNAVKDLGVPVVFCMVMNPQALGLAGKEVTGVEAFIAIETQLDELRAVLPKATRLGIVYAPDTTGRMAKIASEAAKRKGFTLVSRAVRSGEEAISAMNEMTSVDVYWMFPDPRIVTQETLKHLLLLSLERKIPVFGVSEKYVRNGALVALGANPTSLGQQIGGIAVRVLAGEKASAIPIQPIKGGDLYINAYIARRLSIEIPLEVLGRAHVHKDEGN